MNVIEEIRSFIRKEKKYCTAKEISKGLGVSLFSMYSSDTFSIVDLNSKEGFFRTRKLSEADYLEKITRYIKEVDRFVSANEISQKLNISRSSLIKHGMDVDLINESLGHSRGYTKQIVVHNKLSEKRRLEIKKLIIDELSAGFLPWRTLRTKLCLPDSTLKTLNLVFKDLVLEAGVAHRGIERIMSTEDMIKKIRSIISDQGRYCPTDFLSDNLGVSGSILAFRKIDVVGLNAEQGFHRDNYFFEYQVGLTLKSMYPSSKIETQKWFSDLRSDLGNLLFFDFYIEDLKLCVEADGPSHSNPKHPWHSKKLVRRDTIKNEYCFSKGLTLIRVPWKSIVTPQYIHSCSSGTPLEIA